MRVLALGMNPLEGEAAWVGLVALAIAGVLAGVINAMAGGGSFLTIPVLLATGLPVGTTNGTIRVGVLLQNVTASLTFYRQGVRELGPALRYAAPVGMGALAGSLLATHLDDAILRPAFGVAFVLWAVVLLVQPRSFTHPPEQPRKPGALAYLIALLIGVYGGFLQAGVGFPLIAFLVLYLGFDPVRANAIKMLLVAIYTLVALPVFVVAGQVAWLEGSVLALGTMLGAWLGAHWQMKAGAGIVRWFVMVAVAVAGVSMIASAFG